MSTTTANLGLVKPDYSDTPDVQEINQNMDKVDGAVGAVQNSFAILANGNTHAAILSGQFVYVRNHDTLSDGLYAAKSAIPTNGSLSTSNLSSAANGGMNALKASMDYNAPHVFNSPLTHEGTTELSYSGVSVTIPPHSIFAISGYGIYNHAVATEIAISGSDDPSKEYLFYAHKEDYYGVGSVSHVGYADNDSVTLYLHTRRADTSNNMDGLKGWYIKYA